MGVATQDELDALKKRVRDLERAAGMTASGRKTAARKPSRAEEDRGSEDVLDFERPPDVVGRFLTGRTGWAVAASTPSWCAAAWRAAGPRRRRPSARAT